MTSVTNTQESPKVCRPMTVKELMAPNSHQSVKGSRIYASYSLAGTQVTMPEFYTHSSYNDDCLLSETTGTKGGLLHSSSF